MTENSAMLAKRLQGYRPPSKEHTCSTCKNCSPRAFAKSGYCSNGFAVKPLSTCDFWGLEPYDAIKEICEAADAVFFLAHPRLAKEYDKLYPKGELK